MSTHGLAASARKFEIGNLNFAGIYGLSASVGAMLAYGPDRLEDEVLTLAGYLKKRLGAAGLAVTTPPKDQAGIVSYRSAHPAQTVSALMRRRIRRRRARGRAHLAARLEHQGGAGCGRRGHR
jgi:selenocysteine lyase/cysteine desulfurase